MNKIYLLFTNVILTPDEAICFASESSSTFLKLELGKIPKDFFAGKVVLTHDVSFVPKWMGALLEAELVVDIAILNKMLRGHPDKSHLKNMPFMYITPVFERMAMKNQRDFFDLYLKKLKFLESNHFYDVEFKRYCEIEEPLLRYILVNQDGAMYVDKDALKTLFDDLNVQLIKSQAVERYWEIEDPEDIFDRYSFETEYSPRKLRFYISVLTQLVNENYSRVEMFGTVTGRILYKSPAIQFLPRNMREKIFNSKLHSKRIEPDFCAFEPSILGIMASDHILSDHIENETIYELVSDLLTNKIDREIGKICFISLIYGISNRRLISNLRDIDLETTDEKIKNCKSYFNKSWSWIEAIAKRSRDEGYVETALGNHRLISPFEQSEKIANHLIQGTGSLIFKLALNNVFEKSSSGLKLVLPLHDGAIFYSNNDDNELLMNSFRNAFKEVLGVKPRVKIK